MEGYDRRRIHVFEDSDSEPDEDELPARVRYSTILQEEYDFIDED